MKKNSGASAGQIPSDSEPSNPERRKLLEAAGRGVLAVSLGGLTANAFTDTGTGATTVLRWGVVGTGGIANAMAPMIGLAGNARLTAVSSRRLETAREFADKHDVPHAFDSWADMLASESIDAVYVATPTSVREEICIAAAENGKHVLGEKPFANLPSLQRITAACRTAGVGFMDGTHFVHQARTAKIKSEMGELVGWPWSVASAFQFGLNDKGNIRMNPALEPYGAIGDAGWYNMRAAVEYLAPGVEAVSVDAYLRRENENNAVVSGSGIIVFDDGSTSTWDCGFESGGTIMDLRISGEKGVVKLDDFLSQRPPDKPARFEYRRGWLETETVEVPSELPGAARMFVDFGHMVGNSEQFESSVNASERTQALLDAVWHSAVENES
jgi:predicted dehydrogenase